MKTQSSILFYYIMTVLILISYGCNKDEDMSKIPENIGDVPDGGYVELGLSESTIETGSSSFQKEVTAKISDFWIDGVELIIKNDTTLFRNKVKPVTDSNGSYIYAPYEKMEQADFFIEKKKKNIIIKLSENTDNRERKFLFWFGTNRTCSHKLTVVQQGN